MDDKDRWDNERPVADWELRQSMKQLKHDAPEKSKRKNPSKRLRFDVFKRDRFTCQYCGAQPPSVVLVCDHIQPVALNGKTTIDNLITACESCNQGKGAKLLKDAQIRPDADLMYLEVQQEIVELQRFQQAEKQRDDLLNQIAEEMVDRWLDITEDLFPPEAVIIQLLRKYSPQIVQESCLIVAKKVADRQFWGNKKGMIPYLWGVAKRVSENMEA